MRKFNYVCLVILIASSVFFKNVTAQNVGINATGAAPDASSMLDIDATNKGLLIPRVSLTNINDVTTISAPTISLLVYNTNAAIVNGNGTGYYYWNGSIWVKLKAGNASDWNLFGNAGISQPAVPGTYGSSTIGVTENFLGTTDSKDVVIGTNNIERFRIKQTTGNVGIGTAAPANTLQVIGNASIGASSNNVTGTNSVAAGSGNTISNSYSFGAGGQGNTITGQNDIVGGFQSRVQADHSIVVGCQDTTTSSATAVFGFGNKVTGFTGFAAGDRNKVTASNGAATGYNNNANGDGSIVAGQNNTAASYGEAVFGLNSTNYTALGTGSTFNAADRIFNIGNGVNTGARADAFTVLKNGRIGINNNSPNGTSKLDISATDKGLLIPRLALTATNAATPLTRADGAAAATTDLATSLLVYNTNAGITGTGASGVGFYYWDGALWVKLFSGSIPQDHDWYEVGTTTAPDNINDDKFTFGKIGIGINTPTSPLTVFNSTDTITEQLTNNYSGALASYGIKNNLTSSGAGFRSGILNNFNNTGTGDEYGIRNIMSPAHTGSIYGMYTTIDNPNNNFKVGSYTTINAGGSGAKYGNFVWFSGTGTGDQWGTYNVMNNLGTGTNYGVYNYSSKSQGPLYGTSNIFEPNNSDDLIYGTYNQVNNIGGSAADPDGIYGTYNWIFGNGFKPVTGTYNSVTVGTSNNKSNYGVYNVMLHNSNDAAAKSFGVYNITVGSALGTGTKYGVYDSIDASAGGEHYGVYSVVPNTTTGYAAYLKGRLSIGTTFANNYIMPLSRGTNNQIMVTDGSGNVSWQNASTVATQDHDWYEVGTTTAPDNINDSMFHMGLVGIGVSTPASPLDVLTSSQLSITSLSSTTNSASSKEGISLLMADQGAGSSTAVDVDMSTGITSTGAKSILTGLVKNNSASAVNGIQVTSGGTGNGTETGYYYTSTNTGSGAKIGYKSDFTSSLNAFSYGMNNTFSNQGTQTNFGVSNTFNSRSIFKFGMYNNFVGSDTGSVFGVYNSVSNTGSQEHIGFYNMFTGTGNGKRYGLFTFNNSSGTGDQYGLQNLFLGSGSGNNFGLYNDFQVNLTGNIYGITNNITNNNNGAHIGTINNINGNGTGNNIGAYNTLSNTNTGNQYGNRNEIYGDGNGKHYGTHNFITGTGTGNKYASYDTVPASTSGNNFGVFSSALDTLNDFAGYFRGKLSVGMDYTNNYVLPTTRGTNGQIMRTDGNGKVNWTSVASVIDTVAWLTTGNTGTDTAVNFLGTRDDMPLRFKLNNVWAGQWDAKNRNYFIGKNAGIKTTTGNDNIANGDHALYSNTTGFNNIAFSQEALYSNISGFRNIALGDSALLSNTTGGQNIAIGVNSSRQQISGYNNIAIGISSLFNNIDGSGNIGIGSGIFGGGDNNIALGDASGSSSGDYNIFLGYRTGSSQPHKSIFIGYDAVGLQNSSLKDISIGNYALYCHAFDSEQNIAIGDSAMSGGTKGGLVGYTPYSVSNNIAIGTQALLNVSDAKTGTISNNIAIGYQTLMNDTADNNIGIGYQALRSNRLGINNIATGYQALRSNTIGQYNIANGYLTMYNNIDGNYNIANGYQALYANTSGEYNIANGYIALSSNNSGNNNVALGRRALEVNTSGNNNIAIGARALEATTTTDYNTGIGAFALQTPTTGSNNTGLGYSADVSLVSATNATALGYNSTATASNYVRVGNTAVTSIFGAVAFNTSDGRFKTNIKNNVPGLDFILKLRPVTYHFEKAKYSLHIGEKQDPAYVKELKSQDAENKTSSGFIAQEVEQAAKELNYDFDGVYKPQNDKDTYGLGYQQFVVPLVKAVQEQQQIIEKQNENIELLKQQMEELKQLIKSK